MQSVKNGWTTKAHERRANFDVIGGDTESSAVDARPAR